jgi:hypothetical protein
MKAAAILLVVLVLVAVPVAASASVASDQKRATDQLCFASARIKGEVTGFPAEVISPGVPAYSKISLTSIGMDLLSIRGALPGLSPVVRAQAAPAAAAFTVLLRRLAPALLAGPAGAAPPAQVARFKGAVALLPAAYARTLGRIVACA